MAAKQACLRVLQILTHSLLTEQGGIGLDYTYVNVGSDDFQANLTGGPVSASAPGTTARGTDRDFDVGQVRLNMNDRY